jgi:hypothetical protein
MTKHRRSNVPSPSIVTQTRAKLTTFGLHHGVIQACDEHKLCPIAPIQGASIQTLHARAIQTSMLLHMDLSVNGFHGTFRVSFARFARRGFPGRIAHKFNDKFCKGR